MPHKNRKGKGKGSHQGALSESSEVFKGVDKAEVDVISCDIISCDRVNLRPGQAARDAARDTFATAVENGTPSQVGDRFTFGNLLGHQLLEELEGDRLHRRILEQKLLSVETEARLRTNDLKARVHDLEARVNDLKAQTHSLKAQTHDLKESSEGYLRSRDGFLDVFKDDILRDPNAKSSRARRDKAALHGDAVADAGLYQSGRRRDESLLIAIYGVTSTGILRLSRSTDSDSISVLNARATLKANGDGNVPQEIENMWKKVVVLLENPSGTLKDSSSPLWRAYHRFWDVYSKYRRDVSTAGGTATIDG
ncbi:MAG: hypothetical protein M1840_004828 [Geoglossum simile]|nr:MAG: hypothetical protein M1840_004828 [Geoglossum simile]